MAGFGESKAWSPSPADWLADWLLAPTLEEASAFLLQVRERDTAISTVRALCKKSRTALAQPCEGEAKQGQLHSLLVKPKEKEASIRKLMKDSPEAVASWVICTEGRVGTLGGN